MRGFQRWALGLVVLALALPAAAQEQQKTVTLSLQDCIAQTLKNNIGLAVEILNPELAAAAVAQANEKFMPTLSLRGNKQDATNVSYSFLDSGAGDIVNITNNYSLSAVQSVPFGGTFTLSATGYKTSTTQSFQTINPRFGTTLQFSFTQPILRNFGYDISRFNILIARNSLQVSDSQLRQSLMDTVFNVESAYWNLVYSIENLKVRQQSLDLAKDLLETNKRSVEVGTLAPMDILSAQAEVATREADLIQAEAQVKSAQDALAVLINMPEKEQEALGAIVPQDSPSYTEHKTNLDEALAAALQYRPDLESSKLGIAADELNLKYTKNQLLPDLNLSASYSGSGVSGTQIVYQDNNPIQFPIPIAINPGNVSGALKDTFRFAFPTWSVGLTLNVPFANVFSRASFTQAKLNLRQSMLQLENQQQQVFLEIKNGVRNVDANYKRIEAYRVARELAEQKLTAEQEKLRVGQSTNYNVLLFQRDLANARISELNSIIAYNVSLASLDRSMGVTLRNRNIKFTDYIQD